MSTEERSCDILEGLLARLGDSPSPGEEAALRQHMRECPSCSAELRRASRAARALRSMPFADKSSDQHLTDLELAAYVSDQAVGAGAARAVAHLSVCAQCRVELVAVAAALEEHRRDPQAGRGGSAALAPRMHGKPTPVTLGRQGFWQAAAAALVWALQWVCFGFAAVQVIAAYAPGAAPPGGRRAMEFLGLVSRPDWRLWVLVAGLLSLGIGFRLLATQLRAPIPDEPDDAQ